MAEQDRLAYRSLSRRIRPARVATRVPSLAHDWEYAALRMIENYSVTWGGAENLLVPIDESGHFDPVFWPLIELFDADVWNWYVTTWRGHRLANPTRFDAWLLKEAEKWAAEHGGEVDDAVRMLSSEHLMGSVQSPWPPPEQVASSLLRRTAPSFTRGGHVFGLTKADDQPTFQTVDVASLRPLPSAVLVPDVSALPLAFQVLTSSRLGALSPSAEQRLRESGVDLVPTVITLEDVAAFMRFSLPRLGRTVAYGPGGRSVFLDPQSLSTSPYELSCVGLERVQFVDLYREDGPLVLVAGNSVHDFCYANALERCGVQARWLPVGDSSEHLALIEAAAFALSDDLSVPGHDRPRLLTSVSLDEAALASTLAALTASHWTSAVELRISVGIDVPLPSRRLPALLDSATMNEPLEEPFIGDEMARPVPPAYPSKVSADNPHHFTWWVDVEDGTRPLPARAALNSAVVASTLGWGKQVRCGRDAISYFSHQMGFALGGSPLSQLVERPRLRFPDPAAIFDALFEQADLTATESSAGQFRRMATELWGGISAFADDLNHRGTCSLLHAWLSAASSGTEPGIRLPTRRRVLSLTDACDASGLSPEDARSLLDGYAVRGILRRGLTLKCTACRYFDWYPLGELDQWFDCHRCRVRSVLSHEAWRGGDEPAFYYDLAEVVYQALEKNAAVPVRAAAAIQKRSKSFGERSEVEVSDNEGNRTEIDLLIVSDGRLLIGEAKVGDRLGNTASKERDRLARLRDIAHRITADHIVFATAAEFRPATRELAKEVLRDSAVTWEFLDNLSPSQP